MPCNLFTFGFCRLSLGKAPDEAVAGRTQYYLSGRDESTVANKNIRRSSGAGVCELFVTEV